jgi:hypothetical protein
MRRYAIGALVVLFAGSAYVYAAQQAGLASGKRPAAAAPSRAALGAFVGLQVLAWAAWIVCVVGIGLYQNENAAKPAWPRVRYLWYVAMLQPVSLALVAASWALPAFKKCKGASWLVLAYAAYLNMQVLAWISVSMMPGALADTLLTYSRVAFGGFVVFVSAATFSIDPSTRENIDPQTKPTSAHNSSQIARRRTSPPS